METKYDGYIDVKTGTKHIKDNVFSTGIWAKPKADGLDIIVVHCSNYCGQSIGRKAIEKMLEMCGTKEKKSEQKVYEIDEAYGFAKSDGK